MNISVEKARIEDFHAINFIVKEGHEEHANAHPHIFKKVDEVMSANYFNELLSDPDCEIFVARLNNHEVVGFAVMELQYSPLFESLIPRKYAYMNDFGVKETYQRNGIGDLLFQACMKWSREKGAKELELTVWEFNEKAIAFYEKNEMRTISRKMSLKL
ncbi:GNAT family N-acetyltransferase [Ureibacillus composti]|nr:GNAT family N-acetyltransferase [Ureibacillus composti]